MLYITYNAKPEDIIWNPDGAYNVHVEKDWFQNPDVVKVAEEIDGVKHIQDGVFVHPIFGAFSHEKLSGGAKIIILIIMDVFPGKVYPLSWLGDNCYSRLKYVPKEIDVVFDADTIPDHVPVFDPPFISMATGKELSTLRSYIEEYIEYVHD